MDKRIPTKKFLISTNVNLKLFLLLGKVSFFKKDHLRTFDFFFTYERSVLTSIQNWSDDLFSLQLISHNSVRYQR